MKLVIGNKNYSSWSMRAWVLLTHFGIPFEEVKLRFDFSSDSSFYRAVAAYTPTHQVPVLVEQDVNGQTFSTWDTLAIAERVADLHPELPIWPREAKARSRARSLCAEMHADFKTLRNQCPMNVEADLGDVGARLMAEHAGIGEDLARLVQAWRDALRTSGGPFLFGAFSAADAYFAPVMVRITRYHLPVPDDIQAYLQRLEQAGGVREWIEQACAEHDFLDFEEPYRKASDVSA